MLYISLLIHSGDEIILKKVQEDEDVNSKQVIWMCPVDKVEPSQSWKQQIENQLQQVGFEIDFEILKFCKFEIQVFVTKEDQDVENSINDDDDHSQQSTSTTKSRSNGIHRNLELLKILRLWVPESEHFWERKVFYKKLTEDEKSSMELNPNYQWIKISDCFGKLDPEYLNLVSKISRENETGFVTKIREYTRDQFLANTSTNHNASNGTEPTAESNSGDYSIQNQLLKAAKLDISGTSSFVV